MSQTTLPVFWSQVDLFCPVCDHRYTVSREEWQDFCYRRRKHLYLYRDFACANPSCRGARLYPEGARWVALCDRWQGWNDEIGHGVVCKALAQGESCVHLSDFPCPLRKYGPSGVKHRYRPREGRS